MSTTADSFSNIGGSVLPQDMLDINIKSKIDALVGEQYYQSKCGFTDLLVEVEDFSEDLSAMVKPIFVARNINKSQLNASLPNTVNSMVTTAISRNFADNLEVKDTSTRLVQAKPLAMVKPVIKSFNKPNVTTSKNTVKNEENVTHSINNVKKCTSNNSRRVMNQMACDDEFLYPKPTYSYSCLIALALKNSHSGCLPVAEIYNFMTHHFPYFKTAPSGWKNSVRHNLSLNKSFEKVENFSVGGVPRRGFLWFLNLDRLHKIDLEVRKSTTKDRDAICKAMFNPENLECLLRGELKFSYEQDEKTDMFGNSCGSTKSEGESEIEINSNFDIQCDEDQSDYFDISAIKLEREVNVEDEALPDEIDIEDDKEVLRMEIALAQKELLHYESIRGNKRRKLYVIQE